MSASGKLLTPPSDEKLAEIAEALSAEGDLRKDIEALGATVENIWKKLERESEYLYRLRRNTDDLGDGCQRIERTVEEVLERLKQVRDDSKT